MCLLAMEKYQQSVDLARLSLTKRSLKVHFWLKLSQNLAGRVSELPYIPNSIYYPESS